MEAGKEGVTPGHYEGKAKQSAHFGRLGYLLL
jgi:hypothetical protein